MRCPNAVRASLTLVLSSAAVHAASAQAVRGGESTLRVTTADAVVTGILLAADTQAVHLSTPMGARRLSTREVTRVELKGTKAGQYAKVGGFTGFGLGVLWGTALAFGVCDTPDCPGAGAIAAAAAGGVVLGGVGAIGGGLIGSAVEKWTPIDPSTVRTTFSVRVSPAR